MRRHIYKDHLRNPDGSLQLDRHGNYLGLMWCYRALPRHSPIDGNPGNDGVLCATCKKNYAKHVAKVQASRATHGS